MLITVSGIVGSGKTTASNEIVRLAAARGIEGTVLRFQSLPCFAILRSPLRRAAGPPVSTNRPGGDRMVRWPGYRRRRLTAGVTILYLVRILSFRAYRWFGRSDRLHVLNRYFYDLLPHYLLTTGRERIYHAILRRAIPVPDVAILVTAAPETIAQRRPDYSPEYLTAVAAGYATLRRDFRHLIEIPTNSGDPTDSCVAAAVCRCFGAPEGPGEEPA